RHTRWPRDWSSDVCSSDLDEQLKFGGGYDHNYVLNVSGAAPELAVRVTEPKSGRVMEVLTAQPGVQFYTGNKLDGKLRGKGGKEIGRASCRERVWYEGEWK